MGRANQSVITAFLIYPVNTKGSKPNALIVEQPNGARMAGAIPTVLIVVPEQNVFTANMPETVLIAKEQHFVFMTNGSPIAPSAPHPVFVFMEYENRHADNVVLSFAVYTKS
jgi:hypothetical protein